MRPNRKPDFIYKVWEFWIDEGIQCGTYERCYKIEIQGDRIFWQSLDGRWFEYAQGAIISKLYTEWLVEYVLLG